MRMIPWLRNEHRQQLWLSGLLIVLISAMQALPYASQIYAGDTMVHYQFIHCWTDAWAEGQWYPRWCFDSNVGLGMPFFVFYFPLPFLIPAMFYGVVDDSVAIFQVYTAGLLAALILGAWTMWLWLREWLSPMRALLCLLIYLAFPYRLELIEFRNAYAELWSLVWLPLVFRHVQRGITQGDMHIAPLALWISLGFLSHTPTTLVGLFAIGVVLLVSATINFRLIGKFALACMWAGVMCGFYFVPAYLYKPFTGIESLAPQLWTNNFVMPESFHLGMQGRLLRTTSVFLLVLFGYAALLGLRARQLAKPQGRILLGWLLVCVMSLFLLFPISEPVWALLKEIGVGQFPWRMWAIPMFAGVVVLALFARTVKLSHWRQTGAGDVVCMTMLLLGCWFLLLTDPFLDRKWYYDSFTDARYSLVQEYYSPKQNFMFVTPESMLERYLQSQKATLPPKAQVIQGDATAKVQQWSRHGIVLDVQASEDSLIRLDHHYFPIWAVVEPEGENIQLGEEDETSQMMLFVPAGAHHIVLQQNIIYLAPMPILASIFASLLAVLGMVLALFRAKKSRQILVGC